MAVVALVAFLAVHGLLHAAIWLPHPAPAPGRPQSFVLDRSSVLTAADVPQEVVRRLAVRLAVGTTVLYLVSAATVSSEVGWAASVTVAAAALGIGMKVLFFHPWLILGLLLDLLVLSAAVLDWPLTLP
jgi:hypothetical protein